MEEEEEAVLPMEVAEGGAGDGPDEQAAQPDDQQGKTARSLRRQWGTRGGTAGASQWPVAVCILTSVASGAAERFTCSCWRLQWKHA